MKMKKILTISAIIFLFLIVKSGMAQQDPLFSLYHQQLFLVNPAATGNADNMQAFVDARKQWSGMEMAPRTGAFGIHSMYNEKVGLGVLISNDNAGMIDRLSGNLNYSYKLYFSKEKKHSLVFGLGAGFIENKIDFTDARVQNTNDPVLVHDYDGFAFDVRFGMLYNFKGLEIGAAIPQILDNNLDYNRNNFDDFTFEFKRHYLLHAGYRFSVTKKKTEDDRVAEERFYIKPSVMFKTAALAPEQIDLNLVVGTGKKHWLGFTYRPTNNSMVAAAGINVNNLGIAYAYQIANTYPTQYSNGTHEIMLTYNILEREAPKPTENITYINSNRPEQTKPDPTEIQKAQLKSDIANLEAEKAKLDAEENLDDEANKRKLALQAELDAKKIELAKLEPANKADIMQIEDRLDSDASELERMKKELQGQIEKLNKELEKAKNNANSSAKADVSAGTANNNSTASDNGELEKLKKEFNELQNRVQVIKDELVYELNNIKGKDRKSVV